MGGGVRRAAGTFRRSESRSSCNASAPFMAKSLVVVEGPNSRDPPPTCIPAIGADCRAPRPQLPPVFWTGRGDSRIVDPPTFMQSANLWWRRTVRGSSQQRSTSHPPPSAAATLSLLMHCPPSSAMASPTIPINRIHHLHRARDTVSPFWRPSVHDSAVVSKTDQVWTLKQVDHENERRGGETVQQAWLLARRVQRDGRATAESNPQRSRAS